MGNDRAVEEYGVNVDGTINGRFDEWLRRMASVLCRVLLGGILP